MKSLSSTGVIIAFFIWMMPLFGCQEIEMKDDQNFITIQVDSFLHIPVENFDVNNSFFTHLPGQQNRFWHFNNKNLVELIDISGNMPHIQKVTLPDELQGQVFQEEDITIDPNKSNILWMKGLKSTFQFDTRTEQFTKTIIPHHYKLHILNNWILAESQHGIYLYDKNLKPVDTIRSLRESVMGIQESQRFGLVISGYRYMPDQRQLEKITTIDNVKLEDGGLNYLFEADSLIIYKYGRVVNQGKIIVNGKQLDNYYFIGREIDYDEKFFYSWDGHIGIIDLATQESNGTTINLPFKFQYKVLKDDSLFWALSADKLFSIDTSLEKVYSYPIRVGKGPVNFIQDEQYLYILSDHYFSIYNKNYLSSKRERFDQQWYVSEKERYKNFVYEQKLESVRSFKELLSIIQQIDNEFKKLIAISGNGDIIHYHLMNLRDVSVNSEFLNYLLNEDVKNKKLLEHTQYAIANLVRHYQVKEAIKLDSILRIKYDSSLYNRDLEWSKAQYEGGIDRLKIFARALDSIKRESETDEEYKFKEAIHYLSICQIGWFGENYCDPSIGLELLEMFIADFPKSRYRNEAKYTSLRLKHSDWENGTIEYSPETEASFKKFIMDDPGAAVLYKILPDILQIFRMAFDKTETKTKYEALISDLKKRHPKYNDDPEFDLIYTEWERYN